MYNLSNQQKLGITVTVLAAGFILLLIGRYWYADFLYSQSRSESQLSQYKEAANDVQSAINYSSSEAIYYNEMSRIFTYSALDLASKGDATDAAKFVPYALYESDEALSLSPRNMNIRETRITLYMQFAQFDPNYLQTALDLTKETIGFSPTDPKMELILGKIYANMGDINNAITAFNKALALKPDYADAQSALQTVQKLTKQKSK